jgi:hypothetical protein
MPATPSRTIPDQPATWGPLIGALVIGAALVAIMTAPTLTRLTSVGRLDTNDGRFSIWNIAWVGHALLTAPASILDANIFYPHTGTLAYSELNLVAGLFGLPWYAVTRNPLAALNGSIAVALLLAFVLMWALVRRLTASNGAGLVAATAFTFCPYVSARTPHIQLLMIFVFPLVMLAFHRLAERPGIRAGFVLGAALAVAALACGYYGLFTGCALGLVAVLLAQRSRRYWLGLAVAMVTAAVIVAPVFLAFSSARAASGASLRPWAPDDARIYSANAAAYLASPAAAHDWWLPALDRWQQRTDVLFPGVILLVLAVAGASATRSAPGPRRIVFTYLALAGACVWASFGPDGGLYLLMHELIPGMSLLRAPARLGIVAVFALAVVSGFAVSAFSHRRRWLPVVLVVAVACELGVKTEAWGWPSWPLNRVPAVSPAYDRLARLPRGVLVEFPFPYVTSNFHNHAPAMFWSTYHWQPLVNGYSDIIPPDFSEIALPINYFPDPASFAIMKERHVRYVLWHVDRYDGPSLDVLTKRLAEYQAYFKPLVRTPDVWLYEIVQWPS